MQRRQVVYSLAILAAGTAGCSEAPSPSPAPPEGPPGTVDDDGGGSITTRVPLNVTDFTTGEGPDGRLLVEATVSNGARVERRATIRVTASLDGEEAEQRQRIRMDSGQTETFSFVFTFDYLEWQDGDISLDFNFDYLG